MDDFFASLYEWFGLMPLYSTAMGDWLRGWDILCADYTEQNKYVLIGWLMMAITAFVYALQYHIIDSPRWKNRTHWWLFALVIATINFFIAFTIPFNTIQAGDYCNQLNLSVSDCIGFGISNAIWSFVLFILITTIPLFRRFSTNCRYTTFWKP